MSSYFEEVSEDEPGQRFSASGSSWFNYRTNMLHIGGHSDFQIANALAIHEFSHFGLHCATPFGLVLDELCQMQVSLVMGFCLRYEVDLPGKKIPRPLYRFVRKFSNNLTSLTAHFPGLERFPSLAEMFIVPWSLSAFLENALDAEGPLIENRKSDIDACRAVTAYESFFLQEAGPWSTARSPFTADELFGQYDVDVSKRAFAPLINTADTELDPQPVCPRATFPDAAALPIGGLDIFEGVASLLEGWEHRPSEAEQLLNQSAGRRYLSALLAFRTRCQGVKNIESQETYRRFLTTFFAISDLALFMPIGPVYGRLRHNETTWLDIQPGYRFLQALDVLEEDECLIADDQVTALQERICRRLNWPAPRLFFQLGSELKPISHIYTRHRDACKMRLENPFVFIREFVGNDAFETFVKDHCPILVHRGEVLPGFDSHTSAMVRHFNAKISWRIMFGQGYIWSDDLVPKFGPAERDNRKIDLATVLEALPFVGSERFFLVKDI